jgi:hypothetical protein
MKPEELHRQKLKELGYKDEVIDEIVNKYIVSCTYEFAEAYHTEQLKLNVVGSRRELLIAFMEFAINLPEIPEHSTKELIVDKYLSN